MSPVGQTDVDAFECDAGFTLQIRNNSGFRVSHPYVDAFDSTAEYGFNGVDYFVDVAVVAFLYL